MSATQEAVDYTNEAQIRICADTRILLKTASISVVANTDTYALPSDVIALRSIQDSTGRELGYLRLIDILAYKSGNPNLSISGYYSIGATIGFWPVPAAAATYTIVYEARPAPFTSDGSLEVSGDAQRLVDRLVQQMKLADDGQPELAASELAFYQVEMPRLRRRPFRQPPDRIQIATTQP